MSIVYKVDDDNCGNDEVRVERIKFICKLYQQWIKHKQENSDIISIGIYDIIDNEFNDNYDINLFLDDYRFITHKHRDILPYDDVNQSSKEKGDELECDIDSYIIQRMNRNKGDMSRNNQKRQEMFFVSANDDNNENNKDIVIQNILDSLYVFIYHTLRIDFKKYIKNEKEEEEMINDESVVISCFDQGLQKLSKIIKEQQQRSKGYKTTSNRYTIQNNKFVTKSTSQYKYHSDDKHGENPSQELAVYQSRVYGNDRLLRKQQKQQQDSQSIPDDPGLCFMDYLFDQIHENKSKLNENIINEFKAFIRDNEYETDSFCYDIDNDPESNIINNTKNYTKKENIVLSSILNKFVYTQSSHSTLYNAGYRYFYWDYYKSMDKEWNTLSAIEHNGQTIVEGNSGYMIKDWYIERKYKDLREELLMNMIFKFSIQQFNNIQHQSTIKLTSWSNDSDLPSLKAHDGHGVSKCYGIKEGTEISVEHIMCLLFYTNFPDHSAAFSSTFRRIHGFESDESLKARNREYWHWSKYLRECIECFGESFGDAHKELDTVWHGVSAELIFDSTTIKSCGPFSTTAGLFVYKIHSVFIFIVNQK